MQMFIKEQCQKSETKNQIKSINRINGSQVNEFVNSKAFVFYQNGHISTILHFPAIWSPEPMILIVMLFLKNVSLI